MELHAPLIIGPRLLAAVKIGEAFVSMEPLGDDRWRWCVDLPERSFTDDDVRCPHADVREVMGAMMAFLGAFAEAQRYPDSDNRDLFPEEMGEWAYMNSDEISMVALELEPTE